MRFRKLVAFVTNLILLGLVSASCSVRRPVSRPVEPTATPASAAATPTLESAEAAPSPVPTVAEAELPPPRDERGVDYWTYGELTSMTEDEIDAYCRMTGAQREQYYEERQSEAQQLSQQLEEYIRAWYYDGASPKIPAGLLPPSIDNEKTKDWTLYRPEEIGPEKQWYYVLAREEPALTGFSTLYQNNAATHVTYLKLHFIAPFGAQLLVEGDFPHSRFMDYQILEPFDPEFPAAVNRGQMEVPIVDVDIEPDPGHVNPFRVGADRGAEQRHYHLTFELKAGNAVELNPVLQNSYFRAPGNTRVGGPFGSSGPYGDGAILPSILWLRYYVPDTGVGPLGGVPLPKALLRLSSGETFWLQPDFSLAAQRFTTTTPGAQTRPSEPPRFLGPSLGWFKIFDLYLIRAEALGYYKWAAPYGPLPPAEVKKSIRDDFACHLSRGVSMPPPGNIAHSATDCPYNNYLTRPLHYGPGKVYALTGRLPTTPRTRNGEPTMESAEARYWSICHTGSGPGGLYNSLVYGCLMDEEITVDDQNDYIIVFSHAEDRPANAQPECGVTWQDLGPESQQGFVNRWMSVYPDHYLEEYVPNEENIPWETGAWSQDDYDQSLVGENAPGAMGPYHPVIHYLGSAEFESLGCPVDIRALPEW